MKCESPLEHDKKTRNNRQNNRTSFWTSMSIRFSISQSADVSQRLPCQANLANPVNLFHNMGWQSKSKLAPHFCTVNPSDFTIPPSREWHHRTELKSRRCLECLEFYRIPGGVYLLFQTSVLLSHGCFIFYSRVMFCCTYRQVLY